MTNDLRRFHVTHLKRTRALQALAHNPLLQGFLLCGGHTRAKCNHAIAAEAAAEAEKARAQKAISQGHALHGANGNGGAGHTTNGADARGGGGGSGGFGFGGKGKTISGLAQAAGDGSSSSSNSNSSSSSNGGNIAGSKDATDTSELTGDGSGGSPASCLLCDLSHFVNTMFEKSFTGTVRTRNATPSLGSYQRW